MNEWTNGRISFYFSYLNLIYSIKLIQLGPNNIEQRRKKHKNRKDSSSICFSIFRDQKFQRNDDDDTVLIVYLYIITMMSKLLCNKDQIKLEFKFSKKHVIHLEFKMNGFFLPKNKIKNYLFTVIDNCHCHFRVY